MRATDSGAWAKSHSVWCPTCDAGVTSWPESQYTPLIGWWAPTGWGENPWAALGVAVDRHCRVDRGCGDGVCSHLLRHVALRSNGLDDQRTPVPWGDASEKNADSGFRAAPRTRG